MRYVVALVAVALACKVGWFIWTLLLEPRTAAPADETDPRDYSGW